MIDNTIPFQLYFSVLSEHKIILQAVSIGIFVGLQPNFVSHLVPEVSDMIERTWN